jgi:NAD(P)-dependent dehydrogenase (short-subunit alcohol dehydrogenase family)
MTTTLEGSTALVTGATAGIGRAVALQLAQLGAEVIVHGRSAERGAKVVQEIQTQGVRHVSSARTSATRTTCAGWPPRRGGSTF